MKIAGLFILILMSVSQHSIAKDKVFCDLDELARKECHLIIGSSKIILRHDKILMVENKKINLIKPVITAKNSKWENIHIDKNKNQILLSMKIWDVPGMGGQILYRIEYELKVNNLNLISQTTDKVKEFSKKE